MGTKYFSVVVGNLLEDNVTHHTCQKQVRGLKKNCITLSGLVSSDERYTDFFCSTQLVESGRNFPKS